MRTIAMCIKAKLSLSSTKARDLLLISHYEMQAEIQTLLLLFCPLSPLCFLLASPQNSAFYALFFYSLTTIKFLLLVCNLHF